MNIAEKYLSILKKSLLDEFYIENEARIYKLMVHCISNEFISINDLVFEFLNIKESNEYQVLKNSRKSGGWLPTYINTINGEVEELIAGRNFVFTSHSMIGRARMDNLHDCMNSVIQNAIPGDFIETGVWKGGSTIFMRGFLEAHGIKDRKVWVADSFEGLPKPSLKEDYGFDLSADVFPYLAISEEDVRELFDRYELLDEQVCFLKGWFKDTLPMAPIEKLAVLRLDGDLYESTMDALNPLYDKVSPGGFIIVDDYDALPQCSQAIHDFRDTHGIHDPLIRIDDVSVYWQKT